MHWKTINHALHKSGLYGEKKARAERKQQESLPQAMWRQQTYGCNTAHHFDHTITASCCGDACFSLQETRMGQRFTFHQDADLKHAARAALEWFKSNNVCVLKGQSQSSDLNPVKNLWADLKIALHRWYPSSLSELELLCQEVWAKISL